VKPKTEKNTTTKLLTTLITFSVLSLGANVANAQFGNLLKDLKSATENLTNPQSQGKKGTETSNQDSGQVKQPQKPNGTPAAPAEDYSAQYREQNTVFRCTVKGKRVAYQKHFDSEDAHISITLENINPKRLMPEYDYRTDAKQLLYVAEEKGNRFSVTTVYFQDKDTTFGISQCEGMMCGNPNQLYSFTVYKNNKKTYQEFCDEGSEKEFSFPFGTDKSGKLVTKMKEVLLIKNTKLKFSPFP